MITKEKIIETIKGMNVYHQAVSDYLESEDFSLNEEMILTLVASGVLYYAGNRKFIKDNYSQLEAIGRLNADGTKKAI